MTLACLTEFTAQQANNDRFFHSDHWPRSFLAVLERLTLFMSTCYME